MTVLYLIVARGGSKRVPGKNLQKIEGLSLLGYKARACPTALLSTEDAAIQKEALALDIDYFYRPAHLATDQATTEDVVRHAMRYVTACEERYDAIMLLEPSSPFVSQKTYVSAIQMMIDKDADFIFGHVLYLFKWDWLNTRQDLYDNLTDKTYYFDMPTSEAVDIDTPHDLEHARWLAAKGYVDLSWAK